MSLYCFPRKAESSQDDKWNFTDSIIVNGCSFLVVYILGWIDSQLNSWEDEVTFLEAKKWYQGHYHLLWHFLWPSFFSAATGEKSFLKEIIMAKMDCNSSVWIVQWFVQKVAAKWSFLYLKEDKVSNSSIMRGLMHTWFRSPIGK